MNAVSSRSYSAKRDWLLNGIKIERLCLNIKRVLKLYRSGLVEKSSVENVEFYLAAILKIVKAERLLPVGDVSGMSTDL